MRKFAFCLALFFVASFSLVAKGDLFNGDSVSVSLNFASAPSTFDDASPNGFDTLIVNGPTVSVTSVFDPTVTLQMSAVGSVNAAGNCEVSIEVLGVNNGSLANPIADGTTDAAGSPYVAAFLDIGLGNGGTDGLDANQPSYQILSADTFFITTDADALGDDFTVQSGSPGAITGFSAGIFQVDLSTTDFSEFSDASGEFAGIAVDIVVVVPEPSSLGFGTLALGMFGFRRRRNRG